MFSCTSSRITKQNVQDLIGAHVGSDKALQVTASGLRSRTDEVATLNMQLATLEQRLRT